MDEEKSKPGRIVMLKPVPAYRGCMCLRKGSVQRLDKEATKELLAMGVAEVYEDHVRRVANEKKAIKTKPWSEVKKVKPVPVKPLAVKKEK